MLSTLGETSVSHTVFGPACYAHAVGNSDLFQSIRIQGVSSEVQLEAFIREDEEGVQLLSDCNGINCEESCPQIELSVEATICISKRVYAILMKKEL